MFYLCIFSILMIAVLFNLKQADIPVKQLYPLFTDKNSNFFKWEGIDVHFKDEGKGIPIVFLHGTSSSLHTWEELTKLLKPNYRVIRMDLMGFGISGPNPQRDYSMTMYLNFINDFAQFLGLNKFVIAGNSMGGMLAWNYAALHPQSISGLILINSAGFKMHKIPARFKLVQFPLGRCLLKTSTPKWMVKKGLKEVLYSNNVKKKEIDRYQSLMLREGNRQAFVDFIRMRQPPKTELLSSIAAPTLLLWGRHDKLYPLWQAHQFEEQIKEAQLNIIEKSAHIPMEEAPLACCNEIRNFINHYKQQNHVF